MRKLYYSLAGLIVLAAIILIPPFFIGEMAQKRIENTAALLNQNQSVHVIVNDYQRHWFSSTANVEVQVMNRRVLMRLCKTTHCANPLAPVILSADLHIAHGPVFWRMSSENHPASLGVGLANVSGLFGLLRSGNLDQKPLLSMNVSLGFTGDTQIVANSLDLQNLLSRQGTSLSDQGTQLRIAIRDNGAKIKGSVSSQGLDLRDKTGFNSNFNEGFSLSFDERRVKSGLWLGSWRFDLPRWQMVSPTADKPTFDWRGLSVKEERSQGPEQTLNSTFDLSIEQFGDAEHYGPLALSLKSESVDQKTYQLMRDLLEEMTLLQQDRISAGAHTLDQAQRFQSQARMWMLQRQLITLFPQLVRHGAVFSVPSFSLKTPEGEVSAKAKLAFNNVKDAADSAVQAVDVFSILQSANTDVSVSIPKALLNRVITQERTVSRLRKAEAVKAAANARVADATKVTKSAKPAAQEVQSAQALKESAQAYADRQLAEMVKQGILVEEGDQYQFSMRYDQKQLYLNHVQTSVKALVDRFFTVADFDLAHQPAGKQQQLIKCPLAAEGACAGFLSYSRQVFHIDGVSCYC